MAVITINDEKHTRLNEQRKTTGMTIKFMVDAALEHYLRQLETNENKYSDQT